MVTKRQSKVLSYVAIVICLALLVLHGFNISEFAVDSMTIYLLVAIMVFFLMPSILVNLDSLKIGSVEARFKELEVDDLILIFLEAISAKGRWTYFTPRSGELSLGDGIKIFVKDAKEKNEKKLIKFFDKLLESSNTNQIWFASENIGYFRLAKLKNKLKEHYEDWTSDEDIPDHFLNCMWAYSCFEQYKTLQELFLKTSRIKNIKWITEAYLQMLNNEEFENKEAISTNLKNFLERIKPDNPNYLEEEKIKEVIEKINKSLKPL